MTFSQLELFRELQLLTSDYLRQRALYALQDLVTRFLTEDSVGTEGGALQQAVRKIKQLKKKCSIPISVEFCLILRFSMVLEIPSCETCN